MQSSLREKTQKLLELSDLLLVISKLAASIGNNRLRRVGHKALVGELRLGRLDKACKLGKLGRNALGLGGLVHKPVEREINCRELGNLGRHGKIGLRWYEIYRFGTHRLLERFRLAGSCRIVCGKCDLEEP